MIYRRPVGLSKASLNYDRGVMVTYDLPTGTGLVGQVVNGTGLADAEFDTWDNDANKNFGFHVSQGLGPVGLVGSYYYGMEEPRSLGAGIETNETMMLGGLVTLALGEKLTLSGQGVLRTDSYPTFGLPTAGTGAATIEDAETMGIVGEAIWWPEGDASHWYAAAVYNYIDSEADDSGWTYFDAVDNTVQTLDPIDYHTAALHLGYMLHSNVRIACEGIYDIEAEEMRGGLGIIAAF
jgi:hypothetical protein